MERKAYPTDVRDDAWAFVASSLTLMTAEAPQRDHDLREVCNGLRWSVRAGAAWRLRPHDVPPWHTVDHQSHRWLQAGGCDTMVHDLRAVLRLVAGHTAAPSAARCDRRLLPAIRASGPRAGEDGATRRRGSKVHRAVALLGSLWAAHVTAAREQDRRQVSALAAQVHEVSGEAVEGAFVDPGATGAQVAQDAAMHQRQRAVVQLPEAKKGFVVLPKRWGVEGSNAWAARFRRLARAEERLAETLAGLHCVAFALLMLKRFVELIL